MKKEIYHILVFIYQVYVHYYCATQLDFNKSNDPKVTGMKKFAGRFFTGWNFFVQTIFFGVCVLADIVNITSGKSGLLKRLQRIQNYVFTTFMFPLSVFVCSAFWIIYTIDRELVFPKVLDAIFPLWLNHILHTFIVITLLIELYLSPHYLPNMRSSFLGMTIYLVLYDTVLVGTYLKDGIWLYPIFNHFTTNQTVLFLGVNYFTLLGLQMVGRSWCSSVWKAPTKEKLR